MPLDGGGEGGHLMAKVMKNFTFFWNPSLNYDASSKKGFGDDYVKVAKSRWGGEESEEGGGQDDCQSFQTGGHHHHHHHHQDDCEDLKAGGHTPSLINFTSILAMVFMLVFTLTSRWRRESRVRWSEKSRNLAFLASVAILTFKDSVIIPMQVFI